MADEFVDLQDLMLEATANVQNLVMEFQQRLAMPKVKSQMVSMWMNLPDEMKEKFKSERPDEYSAFIESMK